MADNVGEPLAVAELDQASKRVKGRLILVAILLVALPVIALGIGWWMYVLNVGAHISTEASAWGQFGDFIGGLVGTLIALSTLIALAITVYLQARTLFETRHALSKQIAAVQSEIALARDSADSARAANQLSREIFLATRRPWIRIVEVRPSRPLTFANGTVQFGIEALVQNVGNSPATAVFVSPVLHVPAITLGENVDARALQRETIEGGRGAPERHFGYMLFPGQQFAQEVQFGISAAQFSRAMQDAEFILPSLVVVVSYAFTFEGGGIHQTGCILEVKRKGPIRPDYKAKNRSPTAIFPDEGDIQPDDLFLRRAFGGDYAD